MSFSFLDEYVAREQLAVELNVSVRTLDRWCREKRGPLSVKLGKNRIYRRRAIEEYLRRREKLSA